MPDLARLREQLAAAHTALDLVARDSLDGRLERPDLDREIDVALGEVRAVLHSADALLAVAEAAEKATRTFYSDRPSEDEDAHAALRAALTRLEDA